MKHLTKPTVGQVVRVTTRHRSYYVYRTEEWDETTYVGEVLTNPLEVIAKKQDGSGRADVIPITRKRKK